MQLVQASGLVKTFSRLRAVDDVSLEVSRGEVVGFLGPNGAGKSTTMKMLTGLLPASEGRASLFGQEVDPNDMAVRQRMAGALALRAVLPVALLADRPWTLPMPPTTAARWMTRSGRKSSYMRWTLTWSTRS